MQPPHHTEQGFQNYPPTASTAPKGFNFYMRRVWTSLFLPEVPEGHALSQQQALEQLQQLSAHDTLTWLGHSTFLIRLDGQTILTDPFLTDRASPSRFVGPKRFVAPGIAIENLPPIDLILISHSHYDHLDLHTLRRLPNKETTQVLAPLGLQKIVAQEGYRQVHELDWQQQLEIENIQIGCYPSVHESARTLTDKDETLWCSWLMATPSYKLFFAGDSGYSDTIFRTIGEQQGEIDLAIVPIGAYEPREVMWMSHANPEEAVAIGRDVRAQVVVAGHWGTIQLSDEPLWEPPVRFRAAAEQAGFEPESAWVMKIGETRVLE